jgi:hypothetical protein
MNSSTPMLCGHCGKHSAFQVRGEGAQHGDVLWDPYRAVTSGHDGQTITTWRVLECTVCNQPTLEQEVIEYNFQHDENPSAHIDAANVTVLYPRTTTKIALTALPPSIAKEYEVALKVQNISLNLCAVQLRRTLEAIFNHEKAEGKTLEQKVNYLLKSASIPPLLAEMAHLGRQIGNVGAHVDSNDVTEEDVIVLLDFTEVILVYLYAAPAQVTTVRERLKKTPERK